MRYFHALRAAKDYKGSPLYRVDTHVGYEEPLLEWQENYAIQEKGKWRLFDHGDEINIDDVYIQCLD